MELEMNGVIRAFNILEQVEGTASRKEKEAILKSGMDIAELRVLLVKTYDPFQLYYIKKLPHLSALNKIIDSEYQKRYEDFLVLLNNLSSRDITGNAAIAETKQFLESLSIKEFYWYSKILLKDLKIGASEKTINKVFGKNTIPEYKCMLAHPIDGSFKKLPKAFYVEPKLDGMRINAFYYNDKEIVLKSRNGKQIFGFTGIEQDIVDHLEPGYVYDGEIMNKTFNALMTQAFKKQKSGKPGILNLFDVVPIKQFENQESKTPQFQRKQLLEDLLSSPEESTSLSIVPNSEILLNNEKGIHKLEELYSYYLELGYEGVIVKDSSAMYQYKRTNALLKIKPNETFDLEVINVREGTGKYEGVLGAAIVDFDGYHVGVGTGFTDEEREYYWNNKNEIIGKTIEVQAQETTKNKKSEKSLRFPSFKGIRQDK